MNRSEVSQMSSSTRLSRSSSVSINRNKEDN